MKNCNEELSNQITQLQNNYRQVLNELEELNSKILELKNDSSNSSEIFAEDVIYTKNKVSNVDEALDKLFFKRGTLTLSADSIIKEIGSLDGILTWTFDKEIKSLKIYKNGVEITGDLLNIDYSNDKYTYVYLIESNQKEITFKLEIIDIDDLYYEDSIKILIEPYILTYVGKTNKIGSSDTKSEYIIDTKEFNFYLNEDEYFYIGIPTNWDYSFYTAIGKYTFDLLIKQQLFLNYKGINYVVFKSNQSGTLNTSIILNITNKNNTIDNDIINNYGDTNN